MDPVWHGGLQNALARLWAMYEDSENRLIESNHQKCKFAPQCKKKVDKKYSILLEDMDKWMDESYQKIKDEQKTEFEVVKKELEEVKTDRAQLIEQL